MSRPPMQSFLKKAARRAQGKTSWGSLWHRLPAMPRLRLKGAKWLPYNMDVVLPSAVLVVAAVISLLFTVHKVIFVVSSPGQLQLVTSGHGGEVQRLYLDQKDYLEYSPTLGRLNPGVVFTVNQADGALWLTIGNEELFPDLMMALHTMQSFRPGVAWEMVEMCVRTCPDKAVARVAVKGFRQEIR